MKPLTAETQRDEFDAFDSVAMVFAFIHATAGAEGLRELLAMWADNADPISQERLQEQAEELEAVGLTEAAAIVLEAAKEAPTEEMKAVLEALNRFPSERIIALRGLYRRGMSDEAFGFIQSKLSAADLGDVLAGAGKARKWS
jgi:hypothetical protein